MVQFWLALRHFYFKLVSRSKISKKRQQIFVKGSIFFWFQKDWCKSCNDLLSLFRLFLWMKRWKENGSEISSITFSTIRHAIRNLFHPDDSDTILKKWCPINWVTNPFDWDNCETVYVGFCPCDFVAMNLDLIFVFDSSGSLTEQEFTEITSAVAVTFFLYLQINTLR